MEDEWRLEGEVNELRVEALPENPPASLVTVTNRALTSTTSSHRLASSYVTPFFLYAAAFMLFFVSLPNPLHPLLR